MERGSRGLGEAGGSLPSPPCRQRYQFYLVLSLPAFLSIHHAY